MLNTLLTWPKRAYHSHTQRLPESEQAKQRVVNLLALLGFGLSLLYTVLYGSVFKSALAAGLNALFVLGYMGYFVVLRHRTAFASRIWLMVVFLVQMASFALWVFPRESGMHLFVVAGVPLAFLIFGHQERLLRTLSVVFMLLVFFLAELVQNPKLLDSLPASYLRGTYLTVIPVITVMVAVVMQTFLNALRQRDEALRQLAVTDALTGVANRRGLLERAASMQAQAQRLGMPLCVLMLDIDHFKAVNDQHGHEVGDRLLASVAHVLRDSVRKEDAIGRMGGEEFAVVLFNATLIQGLGIAEHLRQQVNAVRVLNDKLCPVTCTISLGATEWNPAGEDLSRTLARADKALYRAKATGRNRVCGAPLVAVGGG
jgi:diguanylate cyclase